VGPEILAEVRKEDERKEGGRWWRRKR
jgi:hypothetical protein